MIVPFNRPYITGNELAFIGDIIKENRAISGDGYYTHRVNELIQSAFFAKRSLLTTSCTRAIELATHLLRLKPQNEVIIPSFTFVSTANPVVQAGARVVFADIDGATLNIDPKDIRRKITPNTRAIFPVHYAGVACDMGAIMEIAEEYNIAVVEDAAQGVNAKYKNKYLGTIGGFGCYSFDEAKNYSSGEGGALLINTDDRTVLEHAEIAMARGTNRTKFLKGQVDKYSWVDLGSSYQPGDIMAAFLYAQLEKLDEIQRLRLKIYDDYNKALKTYEKEGLLRLPFVPPYAKHNAHIYYVLFNDVASRDHVMNELKASGIQALYHYVPLHSSPMGLKLGYKADDLPVSESASNRLLRLPIYAGMTDEEVKYVILTFCDVIERSIIHFNKERP